MNCFKQCLLGVVLITICACDTTTTVDSNRTLSAALSIDDLITSSYELNTIFKPDEIPQTTNNGIHTENGALVDGNRFFFIHDNAIYELISQPHGTFQYQTVVQIDNCPFIGLTAHGSLLYGACVSPSFSSPFAPPISSTLIRVDLSLDESHPQHVASTQLHGRNFSPNGMAVDDRGDIFISNSLSTIGGMLPIKNLPAVIRVRIVDEENFTIQKKDVIPAGGVSGVEPNGVQIKGDRLWLSCGTNLYEAEIVNDGLRDIHLIYQTIPSRFLDDFTILPDNIIAITEIPFPFTIRALLFPNSWPPANQPSKLRFISTGPNAYANTAGEVIEEYIFDPSIAPSSVTLIQDDDGPAFYVTDVLVGGLYLIRPVIE